MKKKTFQQIGCPSWWPINHEALKASFQTRESQPWSSPVPEYADVDDMQQY